MAHNTLVQLRGPKLRLTKRLLPRQKSAEKFARSGKEAGRLPVKRPAPTFYSLTKSRKSNACKLATKGYASTHPE